MKLQRLFPRLGMLALLFFQGLEGSVARAASSVLDFETAAVPDGWKAGEGGQIGVTAERFKSGQQSLCWEWSRSETTLTAEAPTNLPALSPKDSLGFWLYNERPVEKTLRLELLSEDKVVGRCWYVLNFAGWRPLAAPYAQICASPGKPGDKYGFRLTAPAGMAAGRLYVDYVNFACRDTPHADNQQPWIDRPEILHTPHPETFIYSSRDLAQGRPFLHPLVPKEKMSDEERKSLEIIHQRAAKGDPADGRKPLLPGPLPPAADPHVLADVKQELRLHRSAHGALAGCPITAFSGISISAFNSPKDGIPLSPKPGWDGIVKTPLLERLVKAYLFEKKTGAMQKAAELRQAFFDVCDHLLDQGFADGCHNVSCTGFDERCLYAMRDELEETGRWRNMLLAAIATSLPIGGDVLTLDDWSRSGYAARNVDVGGGYTRLLVLLDSIPDPAERLQRLYAFQRAVSERCNPSLGEPYAWDGTVQHHPMFHIEYGGNPGVADAASLAGTCFRVLQTTVDTFHRSFVAYTFMGGPSATVPPNIPGYVGQPFGIPLKNMAELLAKVDPRAAALSDAERTGHLSLNGGCIVLHRRGDWLVAIAGQYKFRRAFESNAGYFCTPYGGYCRNGSAFVVSSGTPPSPWDSGFRLEGWDPYHPPGATCQAPKEVPSEGAPAAGRPQWQGPDNVAGSAFCCGTDMDGDGIWGLEFRHDKPRQNDTLRFRKSAFCFGDRVTFLTTDIARGPEAGAGERAMECDTTLFQNAFGSGGGKGFGTSLGSHAALAAAPVPAEQEPCWIDGIRVAAFPFAQTLPAQTGHWLVDNKHTGYYIHPGAAPLRVTHREQTWDYRETYEYLAKRKAQSLNNAGKPPGQEVTRGAFATAWFEHGNTPESAQCAYALFPRTTPDAMAKFSEAMARPGAEPPYVILQKDAVAHVLHDHNSDTTGYVIFDAKAFSANAAAQRQGGSLLAANRLCCVMLKKSNGQLRLSVASTDMDTWPGYAVAPGRVVLSGNIQLSISGEWKVDSFGPEAPQDCAVTHQNGSTLLTIPYATFNTVNLVLGTAQ